MRRRTGQDTSISLDSLLDVMFNVVGILVLVLVLVQLSVSGAVERLYVEIEDLPEIDEQALALAEQRADELEQRIAQLTPDADVAVETMAEGRITLDRLEAQIERLEELIALDPELLAERQRIEQVLEERRQQRDQLNTEIDEASAERQLLSARLDETPEREQPDELVITLPNPRSAPEGWDPQYVLVANQRVYVYRLDEMHAMIEDLIRTVPREPEDERYTAGRPRDAVRREAAARPVESRHFTTEMTIVGRYENIPRFVFTEREQNGLTADALSRGPNPFLNLLRNAHHDRFYIVFWVMPDSFETYLAARELADRADVPAGWELRDPDWQYQYTLRGEEFRLDQLKARIDEIDEQRARRSDDEDDGPTIPPPQVDRDVGGPID